MTTKEQAKHVAEELRSDGKWLYADTIDALGGDIEFATEIYNTADKIAKDALAELAVLKALVVNTHKAKGRYHSQLAMCALYEAVGLPNVKPISGEKS